MPPSTPRTAPGTRGTATNREDRLTPPERLLPLLADARRRGEPFAGAWLAAIETATAGENGETAAWSGALEATRAAWLRAYERRPQTRGDRAVSLLYEDAKLIPATGSRQCEQCGEILPAHRHRNARYCSSACKRAANYGRERAAA